MFSWLKRKAEISFAKSQKVDVDRFTLGLRGADSDQIALVVAIATHWRNVLKDDGVDLLDPMSAEQIDPMIALKLNKMIRQVQKENPTFATGLMVWLHTIRTANTPELRLEGRAMWSELQRGFPFAQEAGEDLADITGIELA